MSGEEEGAVVCPSYEVCRMGNMILMRANSEDDAIIIYEMFHSLAMGNNLTFMTSKGND